MGNGSNPLGERWLSLMSTELLTIRRAHGAVWVGFNRPDKRNAYNRAVMTELDRTLRELTTDTDMRCLVLHGDEGSFCSGGDLSEVRELADQGPRALKEKWFAPLLALSQRILTFPMPTIAAVRGLALAGGLELACCCDFIVTTEEAKLGDQHINAGLIPGGGATDLLARRIGPQRAKELMLTGRRLQGTEAAEIGLALWSAPEGEFERRLAAFVDSLTSKRHDALAAIKLLMGPTADPAALRRESEVAARDMSGPDVRQLLHSFGS